MLILLPPSETKARPARGAAMRPGTLSFPELDPVRRQVREAVMDASARPDALAILEVPPSLGEEVLGNLRIPAAPARAAIEIYTGVLYDALDFAGLSPAARARGRRRLVISSTLYGAVRPADRIAPYRASMTAKLPGLGTPAAAWRAALRPVMEQAAGRGLIVDCRSGTYAATWTPPRDLAERWVAVTVPGVSHMAKHTRGLVARALCENPADPRRPGGLPPLLQEGFAVELAPPQRAGRPWLLSVTPR